DSGLALELLEERPVMPAPARIVIRARRPGEAAQDGAQDELIDGADGEMSKAEPLDPAFLDRLAVDANAMMALIERKARLPDHRTGNDDLADPAAGVRPRLRAVHDPAQHIQFVRVVARAGNVIHDLRQSDAG